MRKSKLIGDFMNLGHLWEFYKGYMQIIIYLFWSDPIGYANALIIAV